MEEKKSIKISLKTYLISMFIMLLVIGFLLGYILHTGENINKEITEKKEADMMLSGENIITNEVNEDVIVNEEVSEENLVSDEVTNVQENKNENIISTNKTEKVSFSDEEIKNKLEAYLNIFVGHGGPDGILNSLDLMSYQEAGYYKTNDDNYKLTDIPYSEFEKKLQNYTTLDNFKKLNENGGFANPYFKNINEHVAYFDGGWSGTGYEVESVTIKGDYSDTRYVAEIIKIVGEDIEERTTIEFDIQSDNGKCVIANCFFE